MRLNTYKWIGSAIIVTLCTVSLAGCADERIEDNGQFGIWSFQVDEDECGVADIVKDYYLSGEWLRGQSSFGDVFRQDRDSIIRLVHKDRDWNVLRYIVKDDRYRFSSNCRSKVEIVLSEHGRRVPPVRENEPTFDYEFATSSDRKLCRVKFPPKRRVVEGKIIGQITSCIFLDSGKGTFDVNHAD